MRGDTYPALTGSVADGNGAVALTTADTVLILLKQDGEAVMSFEATSVDDPGTGEWVYEWEVGDTDIVGTYAVEVEVTWNTGVIQTFPNTAEGRDTVTIVQDLNEA